VCASIFVRFFPSFFLSLL